MEGNIVTWIMSQSCGGEASWGHAEVEYREGLGRWEGEGQCGLDDGVELVADLACHAVEFVFALLGWVIGAFSLLFEVGVCRWVVPALGVWWVLN